MLDATKRWYALYTNSRAEKKVADLLDRMGVEVYLPLQKTLKQWSDRKKVVHEPLFRSYVFVRVNNQDYMVVLTVPGVVAYVTIAREKIAIPDCQIEAVRAFLGEKELEEGIAYFEDGEEVEVAWGSLKGLRGTLVQARDQRKLVVRIGAINQNISLTLPAHLLKKVKQAGAY
ncbi:MAG: UpxY family transcription antiterminator [Bacteroidales bacterium]|nr:UpxY family transcription antiterminator [Bacteroidales bacterium]